MLDTANKLYEQQMRSARTDKTTYLTGWRVEELSRLNDEGRRIVLEMKVIVQSMCAPEKIETSHKLYKISLDMASFLKGNIDSGLNYKYFPPSPFFLLTCMQATSGIGAQQQHTSMQSSSVLKIESTNPTHFQSNLFLMLEWDKRKYGWSSAGLFKE